MRYIVLCLIFPLVLFGCRSSRIGRTSDFQKVTSLNSTELSVRNKKYIKRRAKVFGLFKINKPYIYVSDFETFSIIKIVSPSHNSSHLSTFWFVTNPAKTIIRELPVERWQFKELQVDSILSKSVVDSVNFLSTEKGKEEFLKFVTKESVYYKSINNR